MDPLRERTVYVIRNKKREYWANREKGHWTKNFRNARLYVQPKWARWSLKVVHKTDETAYIASCYVRLDD
jgi:hypothetical protein